MISKFFNVCNGNFIYLLTFFCFCVTEPLTKAFDL